MITVKRFTDGRPQTKTFETEAEARTWMGAIEEFMAGQDRIIMPVQGSEWFYNTKSFEMVGA